MDIIFLEVNLPGYPPQLGGFVVIDRDKRRAFVRCRREWDPSIDPIDAEVLSGTGQVIESLFESMGFDGAVAAVLELSNVIRAGSALAIPAKGFPEVVADKLAALLLD